ncbi:SdpI family protein [Pseudoduganella sp. SL102]|uniref:SdpI family protein n=1 Tax=Pseudoduganella sp. SL102 TaxID=2995154 RepID=UPI00248B73ED|nr:SdpI family protein [Pseudoduganella sp. SL102]WBS01449.1 SdpI family protein [Pseudoduganella sp. SL102]
MNRQHLIASVSLILAATVLTALCWPSLAETIPIHWNAQGEADGFGPRWIVWLTGPGTMAFALAIGAALPYLSPKGYDVGASGSTAGYIMTLVVGLMGLMQVLLLTSIFNATFDVGRAVPAGICLVLALIGNSLSKVRRNFYIGIRTPWTLASERVWYSTHRVGAKLMVGAGVVGLLAALLGASGELAIGLVVIGALLPVLYSLVLYKRLERAGQL